MVSDSWTIDEVPLDWCFHPGVKLDFRHFADGYLVKPADIDAELKRIGHELQPLRNRRREYERRQVTRRARTYVASGCGMGYAATMYLTRTRCAGDRH